MGLPSYQIPTPLIVDTLQYPTGSLVGVDTATDKWLLNSGATGGIIQPSVNMANTIKEMEGGFTYAAYNQSISIHQWAAAQCIVPLDGAPGVYPAVRVNVATGECYYLMNMGSAEPYVGAMSLILGRRKAGQPDTVLATWAINPGEVTTNDGTIDGITFSDGFMVMLEVAGTNPVYLRASAMPMGTSQYDHVIMQLPTIDPRIGTDGQQAVTVVGTYTDSSSNKLTSGQVGFYSTGTSNMGGAFNFNAGEIDYTEPADTTAPTITAFTIPAFSSSLSVPITALTATDDTGVTGYLITESATPPSAGDAGWSGAPPTSYTFATAGSKTLYAWAKDAAGNVSAGVSAGVVVTLGSSGVITMPAVTLQPSVSTVAVSGVQVGAFIVPAVYIPVRVAVPSSVTAATGGITIRAPDGTVLTLRDTYGTILNFR